MRRGQAEIIGLVVVVLLLVFALIFFVKFKSSDDEGEGKLIRGNLRANSALNALMKVHIENDDKKRQMKDLIEECISNPYKNIVQQNIPELSGECTKAKSELEKHVESIFSKKEFYLIVSKGDDLFSLGEGCRKGISASPFILKNGGKVELKICT